MWSPLTRAKDVTLWDCAEVLFLWARRTFPYNRETVLRAEKVQCAAGLSYWKTLDAALAARRVNPQRQSVAWLDSTFESQQTCDRRVVQSWNSVGFEEDLCSLVCWSIKLLEEKFWPDPGT